MPETKTCTTCIYAQSAGISSILCTSPENPVKAGVVYLVAGRLAHDFNGSDWRELTDCPAHQPKQDEDK